jgi:FtsH-binding integral membrane protein
MTTAAMTMPASGATATLERTALFLLFGVVAALQWFPALAYILLTAMFMTWAAMRVQERTRPVAPAFFIPLAVYAGLTIVAALFSVDPRELHRQQAARAAGTGASGV